ncbi:AmmeMemoRadiSam system protein B [Solemya velesiana gill symbiont]|uniref:MEMO1 family protein BOW51_04460 n=1 Tax=Solemya velesiana gill symbiont TaxID=1918948 RepID=A0A1T2KVX0_9GAMM|nr:AmmeMemoRadiSam system protein B [Solemya velesiana gill symbiont]OOZ36993.1 AmmeMemoRadiSam system protein B [Solemya velesiana gill symbiont]
MKKIRRPAVAGLFYPADPDELRSKVRQFLHDATPGRIKTPKALVAPHAGYIYSGPIAGNAYAQLSEIKETVKRVILFAPSHRMAFRGLAYSAADYFETPLGNVAVDTEALAAIDDLPQVKQLEQPFENEHALEVHIPFLQESLDDFRIVPLLVSDATPEHVEEVLERLWGGDETLIVISSDLSHYLDYDSAKKMDSETTRAIEELDPDSLGYNNACGRTLVSGLLLAARHNHLKVTTLDLRNSGDTAGPRNQVVGYGAYAFS